MPRFAALLAVSALFFCVQLYAEGDDQSMSRPCESLPRLRRAAQDGSYGVVHQLLRESGEAKWSLIKGLILDEDPTVQAAGLKSNTDWPSPAHYPERRLEFLVANDHVTSLQMQSAICSVEWRAATVLMRFLRAEDESIRFFGARGLFVLARHLAPRNAELALGPALSALSAATSNDEAKPSLGMLAALVGRLQATSDLARRYTSSGGDPSVVIAKLRRSGLQLRDSSSDEQAVQALHNMRVCTGFVPLHPEVLKTALEFQHTIEEHLRSASMEVRAASIELLLLCRTQPELPSKLYRPLLADPSDLVALSTARLVLRQRGLACLASEAERVAERPGERFQLRGLLLLSVASEHSSVLLVESLRAESWRVRERAAWLAGSIRNLPAAAVELLKLLARGDANMCVRSAALFSLRES